MIHFSEERWARVQETNRLWRERKLGRPLIQWKLHEAPTDLPEPATPYNGKATTSFDLNTSIDQILDRWEYDLSRQRFLGDAYPSFWPDFGPGIVAEFLGGEAVPRHGTVWFYPGKFEGLELKDIHLTYTESSPWLERIIEMGRGAVARWGGLVHVGMTDLGGAVDVLASLRGTENLLLDLIDCPEEVERLVWEIHDCWYRYYTLISDAWQGNKGYSSWAEVWGAQPNYMLQCDFSYMISPAMFDRFVAPELRAICAKLAGGCFYHQDGIGELPHTPTLHAIDNLAGIQWQPGDGDHPSSIYWFDQQRRIRNDGKLSQTWSDYTGVFDLIDAIGDISHTVIIGGGSYAERDRFYKALARLGIDPE